MGRGRNGPIEQSRKKPKNYREQKRGESQWWRFDGPNYYEKKISLFLPEDVGCCRNETNESARGCRYSFLKRNVNRDTAMQIQTVVFLSMKSPDLASALRQSTDFCSSIQWNLFVQPDFLPDYFSKKDEKCYFYWPGKEEMKYSKELWEKREIQL